MRFYAVLLATVIVFATTYAALTYAKKLKLNGGLDKVLTNPKLHIYAAFIDRYNNQNPTKKLTVLDMFTKTYGDDAVIKLLGTENNIATTGHFTSRLRTELATSWVDTGKTAEDTFTLLKLDKTAYKIFTAPPMHKGTTNPALDLYVAYVRQFNEHAKKTKKKKKIGLLDMFSKTYGDNGVAKMVEMG
ncbi:hypothetical protein JG688_00013005, partial [Phytophthora aleatoria]